MSTAWRLAREASQEPQRLSETFYGLLRSGPPTEVAPLSGNLAELLDHDTQWTHKLEDSLACAIIGGDLQSHLGLLRDLRADAILRPSVKRVGSLGDVLTRAKISTD